MTLEKSSLWPLDVRFLATGCEDQFLATFREFEPGGVMLNFLKNRRLDKELTSQTHLRRSEDDRNFSVFYFIHPITFEKYERDIQRWLAAMSKSGGKEMTFDPEMRGNKYIFEGERPFPIELHRFVDQKLGDLAKDRKMPDLHKAIKFYELHQFINEGVSTQTLKVWPD